MSEERHPSRTSRSSVGSGQYDPVAGKETLNRIIFILCTVYTLNVLFESKKCSRISFRRSLHSAVPLGHPPFRPR